jgi:ADP-ribose pyrophosphatase YjhB (NUDIX family)
MRMLTRRISVRGVAIHDNKLLCVRHKNGPEYWALPGGGLEAGEALTAGVERELIEETGVKPVVGNLLYIQQFKEDDKEYLEFFFHIINSQDYMSVDLAATTHGVLELEAIEFVDPSANYVLPKFLSTEKLGDFIASKQPTRIFSL